MNVITLMLAIAIGSLAVDFISEMLAPKKAPRKSNEIRL